MQETERRNKLIDINNTYNRKKAYINRHQQHIQQKED